jgi:beta-lactam-binding protein with PASTA domain
VTIDGDQTFHGAAPVRDDLFEYLSVGALVPEPGTAVPGGSTVTIKIDGSPVRTPPPVPDTHPATVEVPDVVGLPYTEAIAALGGLYPVADLTPFPPLPPAASVLGFDAYIVTGQTPAAGKSLPYMTSNPTESTVRLTLEARG